MNTIRLAILSLVALTLACTNPCKTLRSAQTVATDVQTIVTAFCDCASSGNALAKSACLVEAPLYSWGSQTLAAAIATWCSDTPKATPTKPLQTREDFAAWLMENGAVKK